MTTSASISLVDIRSPFIYSFFFFNDTATTEIYTLSLHDALPIYPRRDSLHPADAVAWRGARAVRSRGPVATVGTRGDAPRGDRKSTRLNSSHSQISYAVFCLKKKKNEAAAGVRV